MSADVGAPFPLFAGNGPCLGYRKPGKPYQWLKYRQVKQPATHPSALFSMVEINSCSLQLTFPLLPLFMKVSDRAEHLGSGLLHKGLKPQQDTFIGIFAQNRPEVREGITE